MTRSSSLFRTTRPRTSRILFGSFTLFCLLLILRNSDLAAEYMSRGLLLCARTVIPSLFPFMVLSELLLRGGFASGVLRFLTVPLQKLLHLSAGGCTALLPGLLCGFPIGARCATLSLERGEITKEECQRVVAISGVPSSAFLISAVGVSLWGNRAFGVALYVTVLASALLTGILFGLVRPVASPPVAMERAEAQGSSATLLTASVRSATQSILPVCAYVVFFSTLTGTLSSLPLVEDLPHIIHAALTAFLELTSGMSLAATPENTHPAALLSAAAAGWSGMSVHCQILSVCEGTGISFRSYFLSKALQSLLCVILFALLLRLFPSLLIPGEGCMTGWFYLL